MSKTLRGFYAIAMTPFSETGDLLWEDLEREFDWIARSGAQDRPAFGANQGCCSAALEESNNFLRFAGMQVISADCSLLWFTTISNAIRPREVDPMRNLSASARVPKNEPA